MLPIIIGIIILIILIWYFIRIRPNEVLRYNTKCKKCGRKKGVLKCQLCGI